MSRRLTDLQLERYLADSLGPGERAPLEAVLEGSEADRAALAELRADSAALLVRLPPAAFAEKVAPERRPTPFGRRWWLGVATAAVGSLVLVLTYRPGGDDDVRTKGAVAWRVTVTRGGQTRVLERGGTAREGDVLSFEVTSGERGWVAVLSHAPDGWFVYAPRKMSQAFGLQKGTAVLPEAAELDGTTGAETLFLLWSATPFDVNEAKAAFEANPGLVTWGEVVVERRDFVKP